MCVHFEKTISKYTGRVDTIISPAKLYIQEIILRLSLHLSYYIANCIIDILIFIVCHLLRSGVAALFGPQSGTTSSHVQSICDAMEIPHIETRWDYRLKRDDYSVNLYPHPTAISKVNSTFLLYLFNIY